MQGDGQSASGVVHVRVLAGTASSGKPVYEVLPARAAEHDYEILGSPALAYGFAAGDRLHIADDGTYEVVRRGGNVCLRLYPDVRPSDADVDALRTRFEPLDGLVEMPPDRRFIVVTVSVSVGFPAIELAIGGTSGLGTVCEYGNVYDENGTSLGWWTNG